MAQVCENGHVVNWFSAASENRDCCPTCGAKTQTHCEHCNAPIPGGLRHLGLIDPDTGKQSTILKEPGLSVPSYCKCGAAFSWAGKQFQPSPNATTPLANIIIGSQRVNINTSSGSIHQNVAWVKHFSQEIDKANASDEEKQKAKSLLERISENKLLNTIIGAAVGGLTKAALPHK